jgi:GSCFA family
MSARVCYLHVGTGKTGSSAIQYAFTKASDALLASGYFYPDAANNFETVLAGRPTAGNAIRINAALKDQDPKLAVKLVKKYSDDPRHLVLSCEGLSSPQRSNAIREFAAGLRVLGYETKALVLFRPQAELVVSSYLQQLKANIGRVNVPLNQYVDQFFGSERLAKTLNWYKRAEDLDQTFDHLTVKWFPAIKRLGPDAIVLAAFSWLGLPVPDELDGNGGFAPVINPTPGQEALAVLRTNNASGNGGREFADQFLKRADEAGLLGSRIVLDRAQLEMVHAATFDDNRRLLKQHCPDLSPDAELALPAVEPSPRINNDILRKLDNIAADVLLGLSKGRNGARKTERWRSSLTRAVGTSDEATNSMRQENIRAGRCIIHIGMHKTGSTSIQKSLHGFENEHFLYADLGSLGNHSLAIYSLFSQRPEQHHLHRARGRDQNAVRAYNSEIQALLAQSIAKARGRTLIISGEDISVLPLSGVEKLRDYFCGQFAEVGIVAYVRPPAALMASAFQQHVKGGSIRTIDPSRIYRQYQSTFAKFDDAFGRDNVKLWKFDPQAFPENDVVQDFCHKSGILLPKHKIVRMNESLSRPAIGLLYAYSKFAKADGPQRLRAPEAIRLGQLIDGDKFRFSPDLIRPVLEKNRSDIAWMEERLGQSLQEDTGTARASDVRCEADLLQPDPNAVSKLLALLPDRMMPAARGQTPEEVAQLVQAWRETLPQGQRRRRKQNKLPDRQSHRGWTHLPMPFVSAISITTDFFGGLLRSRDRRTRPAAANAQTQVEADMSPAPNRSPYENLPKSRFWRTGVGETSPQSVTDLYKRKFEIGKETPIATAGSCFAQHIGGRLNHHGFKVLDLEPAPPLLLPESAKQFGYGIYSARYGNIYLMRQLLQLTKEALGKWSPTDIVWTKNGNFFDALRPGIEPEGLDSVEEVLAHRKKHLAVVRQLLSEMQVFVFTFGLTEGWVHRQSQTVYPTAPGTIAGAFDPTVHEFKNFTFAEIMADFLAFRELVRAINPDIRFLLTISPVPLTATASGDHVLAATTYSKAVLRAVAGQLQKEFEDIDYFPSFEIVASHWSKGAFFEPNLRSVTPDGVDAVMRIFFSEHDPQGNGRKPVARVAKLTAEGRLHRRQHHKNKKREEEVCEEAMLEAFNR